MSMNVGYGEVVYETSRAFADDEDDDQQQQPNYTVTLDKTEAGYQFLNGAQPKDSLLCLFSGQVSIGFARGFVTGGCDQETLLGSVSVCGGEGTVDSLLERPKKKTEAQIIQLNSSAKPQLLFALVNSTSSAGGVASNDILQAMLPFIESVSRVVVFHSQPLVTYIGPQAQAQHKVFQVNNNAAAANGSLNKVPALKQPNLIGGISAAVLTYCEMVDKAASLFVNYCESELVDSISVKPFLQIVKESKLNGIGDYFDAYLCQFSLKSAGKTNIGHQAESNLYI